MYGDVPEMFGLSACHRTAITQLSIAGAGKRVSPVLHPTRLLLNGTPPSPGGWVGGWVRGRKKILCT